MICELEITYYSSNGWMSMLVDKDRMLMWPGSGTHPWFDHHERGHNRTVHLNRAPTMDY